MGDMNVTRKGQWFLLAGKHTRSAGMDNISIRRDMHNARLDSLAASSSTSSSSSSSSYFGAVFSGWSSLSSRSPMSFSELDVEVQELQLIYAKFEPCLFLVGGS